MSFEILICLFVPYNFEALLLFEIGWEPNAITFLSVLSIIGDGIGKIWEAPGFISPFDFNILFLNFYIN